MVTVLQDPFHKSKDYTTDAHYELHDQLEDGTLPFHNTIALDHAFDVHTELYGSIARISQHTQYLIARLHAGISSITHANGKPLCRIYTDGTFGDPTSQGATLAFNVQCADGTLIPYTHIERLADTRGIYLRSGGLYNPDGIASQLSLAPWEMKRAWSPGHRCGRATEIVSGKATGVVRASLGAMSTRADIDAFVAFMARDVMMLATGDGGDLGEKTTKDVVAEAVARVVPNVSRTQAQTLVEEDALESPESVDAAINHDDMTTLSTEMTALEDLKQGLANVSVVPCPAESSTSALQLPSMGTPSRLALRKSQGSHIWRRGLQRILQPRRGGTNLGI